MSAQTGRLTDAAFWDQWWQGYKLPAEVRKGERLLYDVLTGVIDRHIPRGSEITTLEIGGAPGQWLAYFAKQHGHRVQLLDISEVGVRAAQENFRRLGLDLHAVLGDMFERPEIEPADVVFSIGLIEHFEDLSAAVAAHVKFLKPGGVLILACPNFLGLTGWYKRTFEPRNYAIHKRENMDLRRWDQFERQLGLEPIEKRYIGGLEPTFFRHPERPPILRNVIALLSKLATVIFDRPLFRALWSTNRRWWDSYSLGIYRKAS